MNMLTRTSRFIRGLGRSRAAAISSLAGQAAGIRRRGTVLVLILGALALLSVVTLVYVIVGRGDRRTAAVVVEKDNVNQAVQATKDYISKVIADGAFAVFAEGYLDPTNTGTNSPPNLIRKQWDYPYTDVYRRSVLTTTPADQLRRFNPTGSYSDMHSSLVTADPRLPYEPWLASTAPCELIFPTSPTNPRPYNKNRDWLQISNFSPDGRFVNLGNLAFRLNPNDQQAKRISGFDAAPVNPGASSLWTPRAPAVVNGAVVAEMSYGLTRNDPSTGTPYGVGAQQLLPNRSRASSNIPAHWTMWQQQAFKLAGVDPLQSPGKLDYLPYQWCDTDRDGFFDARWFELVDASDPSNPVAILPRDDRFRWFIAARAVDLCALVNVNTATDLRIPPRQTAADVTPLGVTPADVDLLRLLRMDDVNQIYGINGNGYTFLQQPVPPNPTNSDDFSTYNITVARNAGETGYNAIRLALRTESPAIADAQTPMKTLAATPPFPLSALTGDARTREYLQTGGQTTAQFYMAPTASLRFSGKFGTADLQELLTRRTINDPGTLSRLEQATDGRSNVPNGGSLVSARQGPLRSVRSDTVERLSDDISTPYAEADLTAWARINFDIRHLLTTINASRPLVSKPVTIANASHLAASELAVDAVDAAKKASHPPSDDIGSQAQRDPSVLFKGYASALLPGSDRPNYWSTGRPQLQTTAFGYNPELALRTAAFMTANFVDMYDKDDQPTAYTLLIDDSYRSQMGSHKASLPWWSVPPGTNPSGVLTYPGQLDLGTGFLPDASTSVPFTTHAINVYGIEAQPFITQVVSFWIYTDAPTSALGTDEAPAVPTDPLPHITIKGDVGTGATTDPDFLGQVLAFQLTNPFDVVVPLTQSDIKINFRSANDRQFSDFYIEYNHKFFMMVKDDPSGAQTIVLQPGETRTFYILSNTITDMQTRWDNVSGPPSVRVAGTVESFLDNQLAVPQTPGATYDSSVPNKDLTTIGNRVKPIRLKLMNVNQGLAVTTAAGDLFSGSDTAAKKNVYLWRAIGQNLPGALGTPGDRSRHILADRLRDPGTSASTVQPTLERRMAGGDHDIQDTQAGVEFTPNSNPPVGVPSHDSNDNTGYTIAFWGSVRRRDDPKGGGANMATDSRPVIGALPAYCLESKWTSTTLSNKAETDTAKPDNLSWEDFDGTANAERTVLDFINKHKLINGFSNITNPGDFPGVIIKSGGTYATMTARADQKHQTTAPSVVIGTNANAISYDKLYPQAPLQNKEFTATLPALGVGSSPVTVSTLRIADMLLPLGIGPCYDPGLNPPALSAGGLAMDPENCMTLSEALALALNYSNPPATGDRFSIYNRIGDHPTGPSLPGAPLSAGALDRGNLSLDKFVPFVDTSRDGILNPTERISFPGIPIALNILSSFRTLDPQFGSLTRGTPGLININTATAETLRALPLLSPTTDISSLPGFTGAAWPKFNTDSGVAAGDGSLPNTNTDIASGILAYRDKIAGRARDNLTIDSCADTGPLDPFPSNPYDRTTINGRFQSTNVQGTREQPGFATVGEILNVSERPSPTGAFTNRLSQLDQIDFQAKDNLKAGTPGTSSVLYKATPGATASTVTDNIVDDYQERLLVAAGVRNSITVRSDVFAVWFVIHGYQRSDTEGLGADDPLVPSIAKRFLMVVDRSNVTHAGEKPRILLFTELPM